MNISFKSYFRYKHYRKLNTDLHKINIYLTCGFSSKQSPSIIMLHITIIQHTQMQRNTKIDYILHMAVCSSQQQRPHQYGLCIACIWHTGWTEPLALSCRLKEIIILCPVDTVWNIEPCTSSMKYKSFPSKHCISHITVSSQRYCNK